MEIFTDIRDGQQYRTIKIGSQVWFAENLKFCSPDSWAYRKKPEMENIYGRLYTWEAAFVACPKGWHIPADEEWEILLKYLGGAYAAGRKMKEASVRYWKSPNADATNESGFTALPGGQRLYGSGVCGTFCNVGEIAWWWTTMEALEGREAFSRSIGSFSPDAIRTLDNKLSGLSVRCVRD